MDAGHVAGFRQQHRLAETPGLGRPGHRAVVRGPDGQQPGQRPRPEQMRDGLTPEVFPVRPRRLEDAEMHATAQAHDRIEPDGSRKGIIPVMGQPAERILGIDAFQPVQQAGIDAVPDHGPRDAFGLHALKGQTAQGGRVGLHEAICHHDAPDPAV